MRIATSPPFGAAPRNDILFSEPIAIQKTAARKRAADIFYDTFTFFLKITLRSSRILMAIMNTNTMPNVR